MIEHIVLVEVPPAAESRRDEIIRRFRDFAGQIPGVVEAVAGYDFGGRCEPYSIVAVVRIDTREHLEGYAVHPAHRELVAVLEGIGSHRIVADIEA